MTLAASRSPLDRLRAVRDEHGGVWGALFLANRLLTRLTRGGARLVPYAFVAQPVGPEAFASLREDAKTVVRRVGPDDALTASFPRPAEVNRARYRDGAECYAVEVDQRFAGHIWLSRGRHAEDEVRCDYRLVPAQSTVWDFDVYVVPAYRVGRTMAKLWKGVNARLSEQQISWSLSRISLFNSASLRAHERLGAVRLATAVFLVIGTTQCAFFSRAPFFHVSSAAGRRPVVELRAPGPG